MKSMNRFHNELFFSVLSTKTRRIVKRTEMQSGKRYIMGIGPDGHMLDVPTKDTSIVLQILRNYPTILASR